MSFNKFPNKYLDYACMRKYHVNKDKVYKIITN